MRRRRPVELSVALRVGGALALVALMFATSWYGLSTPARGTFATAGSTAAGPWSTLHVLRWLLLLAAAAALLSVGLRRRPMVDAALVLALIAGGGLFIRLLVALPDPRAVLDVKVGGYGALIACGALCLGAWEAQVADTAAEVPGHG